MIYEVYFKFTRKLELSVNFVSFIANFIFFRETYNHHTLASKQQQLFMEIYNFTCQCDASKTALPVKLITTSALVIMEVMVMLRRSIETPSIEFTELLQESNKEYDLESRKALVQHLYQMIFMQYQLDYSNLYKNILKKTEEFKQGIAPIQPPPSDSESQSD